MKHVAEYVISVYGSVCGNFIVFCIKRILEHKYFRVCVSGRILYLKKLRSLSIGEHIATAFANILRHALTCGVLSRYQFVHKHWGFVDDTLSVCVCSQAELDSFMQELDDAIKPLRWEHVIDSQQQHFLDLNAHASIVGDKVTFHTSMYRKPSFKPHYLSCLSDHNVSCKTGIFDCEVFRITVLSSKREDFVDCVEDMIDNLALVGYPRRFLSIPEFSEEKRLNMLQSIRANTHRCIGGRGNTKTNRRDVFFSMPFSSQAKSLQISKLFRSSFSTCPDLDNLGINLRVAWSTKMNSMRRLYRLNWPRCAQSMGIG